MLLVFGSIRLLCLPVLLMHIAIALFVPQPRQQRWLGLTTLVFLVFLFVPVDVEIGGFHGSHWGDSRTGPRFVPLVMGMPNLIYCEKKYGEFISGGCCVLGNEPRWLFVWEEAGFKAAKLWPVTQSHSRAQQ